MENNSLTIGIVFAIIIGIIFLRPKKNAVSAAIFKDQELKAKEAKIREEIKNVPKEQENKTADEIEKYWNN